MIFSLKFQSLSIVSSSDREDGSFKYKENIGGKVKFSNHREVLELETGEEFSHSDLSVETYFSIYPQSQGEYEEAIKDELNKVMKKNVGFVQYLNFDKESEGHISFVIFVTEEYFSKLVENIQSGMYPSGIIIDLEDRLKGPIQYEGMMGERSSWKNKDKKNWRVGIEDIRFDYGIIEEVFDEESQKEISVTGKTVSEKSDPNLGELSLIRKSIDKSNTIMFAGFLILVILLMVS
tara:strand:- start:365 stop:1069 length:705 start_codon:yes stop_codon:yes gene_type:complete